MWGTNRYTTCKGRKPPAMATVWLNRREAKEATGGHRHRYFAQGLAFRCPRPQDAPLDAASRNTPKEQR